MPYVLAQRNDANKIIDSQIYLNVDVGFSLLAAKERKLAKCTIHKITRVKRLCARQKGKSRAVDFVLPLDFHVGIIGGQSIVKFYGK